MTKPRAQSLFRAARVSFVEMGQGRWMVRLAVKDRPARHDDYRLLWTLMLQPPVQPTSVDEVARMIAAALVMQHPDAD